MYGMILKKDYVSIGIVEFEKVNNATFLRSDAVNVVTESGTVHQVTKREDTDIIVTLIDCGQTIFDVVLEKLQGDKNDI